MNPVREPQLSRCAIQIFPKETCGSCVGGNLQHHLCVADDTESGQSDPAESPLRVESSSMRNFRIRPDIERVKVGDFALPLGVARLDTPAPIEGFTIKFEPGEEGEPDSYAYQVVVSHDEVRAILHDLFELLPSEVSPVVEIGSVDAYRSIDVYVSSEPISVADFTGVWDAFEPILLEEVSIGAGVTAEDPLLEIFVDAWKSITIHCPEEMRSAIEERLESHGIEEVPQTWPDEPFDEFDPPYRMREILLIEDEHSPDIDEFLLQLRTEWGLQLNVDPDSNVDEAGRELGHTLWHAIAMADPIEDDVVGGAYVTVWATAASLEEVEGLVETAVEELGDWVMHGVYSIERVAYDERPDELHDLAPLRKATEVHMVALDEWGGSVPPDAPGGGADDAPEPPERDDDSGGWGSPGGRLFPR